jgi:monoamine oxidase
VSTFDRRHFLRLLALQAAAWSLSCGRHEGGVEQRAAAPQFPPNPFAGQWQGDDFTAGHALRDGLLPPLDGGVLEPAADVVVVGGGISGMTAAHRLAKPGRRVVVLEQARETGGNAKSAKWGEIEYSIGAAYLTRPDPGSPLETLYRELGVLDRAVKVSHGEVFLGGKLAHEFWEGATQSGGDAQKTRDLVAEFRKIYDERYPVIPWTPATRGWSHDEFAASDAQNFAEFLAAHHAPQQVRQFCEYYCWSSFGGAASEISTYAALNFMTAEFGEILALPGGNAGVAHALANSLAKKGVTIATGTIAARVRSHGRTVEVAAIRDGVAHRYPAKACVVAVPRFIAARIVSGFPEARREIVSGMKWRAYIVANVLLARRPDPEWYDAYRLGELDPKESAWTDLIVADFVASPKSKQSVLTAYRALPYDGGRPTLLADDAYATHRDAVRRDLVPWLAAIGLEERDIVDINLARWGHPLVLSQPGQLSSGSMEKLSAPLGRVTFAHQDRYGVPAIENAIAAAFAASAEVERLI